MGIREFQEDGIVRPIGCANNPYDMLNDLFLRTSARSALGRLCEFGSIPHCGHPAMCIYADEWLLPWAIQGINSSQARSDTTVLQ